MMMRILISLISVCLILSSCGVYTFSPKGKSTINSISIELFTNETAEYGLEDKMTNQIIDAFIADGSIKVVAPENAETSLVGILTQYERRPYNPDINDQVEQYAITMYFTIKLINNADGVEIWNQQIKQLGVYNLEDETEENGQTRAVDLLVEDILNKTTKSW
jgi:hypothetical protein